jgi:5-methylcytosine-specific restriction endonuclease McrA
MQDAYRLAHPEQYREYRRAGKKRNPEANRSYVRARKTRLRGQVVVHFTPEQLRQRLSMFAGCWMCGGRAETIDHVKPIAKGGAHMLANLRPACLACNSRKQDRWPLRVVA